MLVWLHGMSSQFRVIVAMEEGLQFDEDFAIDLRHDEVHEAVTGVDLRKEGDAKHVLRKAAKQILGSRLRLGAELQVMDVFPDRRIVSGFLKRLCSEREIHRGAIRESAESLEDAFLHTRAERDGLGNIGT